MRQGDLILAADRVLSKKKKNTKSRGFFLIVAHTKERKKHAHIFSGVFDADGCELPGIIFFHVFPGEGSSATPQPRAQQLDLRRVDVESYPYNISACLKSAGYVRYQAKSTMDLLCCC